MASKNETKYYCECGCTKTRAGVIQNTKRGILICRTHRKPVTHYIKKCWVCKAVYKIKANKLGSASRSCPACKRKKKKHVKSNTTITLTCGCGKEFSYFYYGGDFKTKCPECLGVEKHELPLHQGSVPLTKGRPGPCDKCGKPRAPGNWCLCAVCFRDAEVYSDEEPQVIRV